MRDDSAQLVQPVLGLVGNDVVGALIDGDRAPLVGFRFGTGHRLEELGDVRRLGVIDLQQLPTQRRQIGNLLLRFELLTLTGSNFIGRRNQQDIADLALVQPLGFQHQIQRLIPRHVLQAQGNSPLDRVAGHQIEVGEIGDQLQHRAHIDVLEVQR
ncbi:hypothetical protein D3C71_863010 [compost metagenome]